MADIAQLGFAVDTGDLKDAKASLDALVPSAAKVEGAANKVENAMNGVATGADRAAAGASKAGAAMGAAAGGATTEAGAMNNAAGAIERKVGWLTRLIDRLRGVTPAAQQAANGVRMVNQAANDNIGAMRANTGNIAAQFQDIGVTAAMGMSPLMIALQQGTQLSAVFAASGQSAFRALGGAIAQVLAPTALLTIGLVALAAAGLQMVDWTKIAKTGLNAVASGMDYLAASAETLVPIMIAVGAVMLVAFGPQIIAAIVGIATTIATTLVSAIASATSAMIAFALANPFTAIIFAVAAAGAAIAYFSGATIDDVKKAIDFVIGGFVGAFNTIKRTWSFLPAAIGDAAIQAVNWALKAISDLINKSINGINAMIDMIPEFMRPGKIGQFGGLGQMANPYAGSLAKVGNIAAEEMGKAQGVKYVDGFIAGAKGLLTRGANAIRGFAAGIGKDDKKKKKAGAGGKTEGEKFEDIVTGANADIAKENARAAAAGIEMTAEAAATLEYKTKLLNEAQQKGITLTAAMRSQIDQLASAYGKAKVAADNAVGLRDTLKTADADIANIKAQADMIGLYGRQLAYATEMQKLLNEAKSKGMTPEAIAAARPQFEKKAGEYADASSQLDHDKFMEDQRRTAQERMITLQQEQAMIGLSADETTRLRIENDLLAQARQKNIDLTPADIAAIQGIAREQANVENAIRKTREAMEFAKDVTKGFFNDLRSNLQQGQSVWEAFGNAVLNVLNKIIDKLMDKMLDSLIDGLFASAGSGGAGGGITGFLKGLFNAKGNVFGAGGLMAFAGGGAFTNGVVSRPTAFAFGKGKVGVMGEAGDEAIMPLQRGPDGSLGVQMYGESGGGTVIHAPITVQNDNRVSGAVSSQDIVELQRRAGEQTKRDIARQIPAIIQQYQRDGAMV